MGRTIAVLAALALVACWSGTPAASADVAQPNFVSTSPALTFSGDTASTRVQVLNPGDSTTACFQLFVLPRDAPLYQSPTPIRLRSGITTIKVSFAQRFDTSFDTATLLMTPAASNSCPQANGSSPQQASASAAQPQPETIELSLVRATPVSALIIPLLCGFGLAIIPVGVLIALFWTSRSQMIRAGSAWNFGDSFATNATAVGGIFATALTAFGASSTLLPAVQTDRYALLSALWASLAIAAPIIVGLVTTPDTTADAGDAATSMPLWGLLLALVVILVAAGAQLTTLIVLLARSSLSQADRTAIAIVLFVFGVVLAWYVVETTRTLLNTQAVTNGPHSRLQSAARTSLLP